MGALTTALIAIAAIALGWITVEVACKPCLEKGREAIDRNLNPDYDPDDDINTNTSSIRAPLNPSLDTDNEVSVATSTSPPKSI